MLGVLATVSLALSVGRFIEPAGRARTICASLSRRELAICATGVAASSVFGELLPASAAEPKVVAVAGATGQTGRRVLERLAKKSGLTVIGGVRDLAKAQSALASSSTVVRGAMLEKHEKIMGKC